jgi:hypothetical protein
MKLAANHHFISYTKGQEIWLFTTDVAALQQMLLFTTNLAVDSGSDSLLSGVSLLCCCHYRPMY